MNKFILFICILFTNQSSAAIEEAIFAGGNFWRLEAAFNKIEGVLATVTGYDGGTSKNPTDDEVAAGRTDYVQAIRVIYNPNQVSYQQIVDYFWRNIDPTMDNAQFCDYGKQYKSVIFYLNPKQQAIALASQRAMKQKFNKIYTKVRPSTQFYAADDDNQGYFKRHPFLYKYYLYRCSHEERVRKLWQTSAMLIFNINC